jgi:lipoprotein-releasing system ATP-binding protein
MTRQSQSEPEMAAIPDGAQAVARNESGSLLRAEGLHKVFRSGNAEVAALAGVDLDVTRGEMIAIVGPSGAGKSTLLHLLAALDTPTSGTVYFGGNSLESLTYPELVEFRSRAVGFVWQRHHLLPDFTGAENVAMPLLIRGVRMAEALKTAGEWLEEVGLTGRARHRAGELSGGEQQRVAIARALVTRPMVLLADEPTGDLDGQNAEIIFELIQRLHRSHRLTSILATHNLSLARRADRVLVLEHGFLASAQDAVAGRAAAGVATAGGRTNAQGERG